MFITRPPLNMSSSGSSGVPDDLEQPRRASFASASTKHCPARCGIPRPCRAAENASGTGGASIDEWSLAGKCTMAPFSATTPSTKRRSPATCRNSSRIRPVTSSTAIPLGPGGGNRVSNAGINPVIGGDGPVVIEREREQLHGVRGAGSRGTGDLEPGPSQPGNRRRHQLSTSYASAPVGTPAQTATYLRVAWPATARFLIFTLT